VRSKNKPSMTAAERQHVDRVKQLSCVVCDEPGPCEAHEPEQGLWLVSIALCPACHRGSQGWHGTRQRWTLRKMDELKAINETHRRLAE
jgi:hypothetical protein